MADYHSLVSDTLDYLRRRSELAPLFATPPVAAPPPPKVEAVKPLPKLPGDAKAKEKSFGWLRALQPVVIVVGADSSEAETTFLQRLFKATVRAQWIEARFVEAQKGWDHLFAQKELKLLLILEPHKQRLPHLMAAWQDAKGYLMHPVERYGADPTEKRKLWQRIQDVLA